VTHETFSEWMAGEPKGVTITGEGELCRGADLKKIADMSGTKAQTVWSIVADKKGVVYMGTGPKGQILKVSPDGKVEVFAEMKEQQVHALALDGAGNLYAGTSPNGKVYRFDKENKPVEFFKPGEKYIWNMLWEEEILRVATGTQGKLFCVTKDGRGKVEFDSEEPNLRCLLADGKGGLLIGTEGSGRVLRVGKDGKAETLYDAPHREIVCMALDEKKRLAFIGQGEEKNQGKIKRNNGQTPAQFTAVLSDEKDDSPKDGGADEAPMLDMKAIMSGAMKSAQIPSRKKDSKGAVYMLEEPGFAKEIWRGRHTPETLLSKDGEWLIGTSDEGFLFGVDDRGRQRVVARAQADVLNASLAHGGHFFVASSQRPQLFELGAESAMGVYQSAVVDAGGWSRWGALRVSGDAHAVRTRSGNTAQADKTWSEWVGLKDGKVASPSACYLQYEIQIAKGFVRKAELYYLPKNLKPNVSKVLVLPTGAGHVAMMPPPTIMPAKTIQQLLKDGGRENEMFFSKSPRLQSVSKHGARTVVWDANDPNQDTLVFGIYVKREDETDFRPLEKEADAPFFSFDTEGWADGRYVFKVTASDLPSNPDAPLGDELCSEKVLIDNTPPAFGKVTAAKGEIVFEVSDVGSVLTEVFYSRDGVKFYPLSPVDEVLDSGRESFRVKVAAGEKLFFKAEDEAGNTSGMSYTENGLTGKK